MSDSEASLGDFYSGHAPHTSVVPPEKHAAMPPARLPKKRKELGGGSGSFFSPTLRDPPKEFNTVQKKFGRAKCLGCLGSERP